MFYALAKGKIPLNGFQIEHVVQDIETLNQWALGVETGLRPARSLEVTALSCHAFALVSDRYQLIPYGSSFGKGYGPTVIARAAAGSAAIGTSPRNDRRSSIRGRRVAVPGRYTTAFLTLQIYEPDFEPVFTPFDQIFTALEKGAVDFGLLIHEGQLTYKELGFEKVVDLGEWWAKEFHLPLPLGINAIRRDLPEKEKTSFTRLFKESIDYAMVHRGEALEYALQFGRGIDAKKGDRFVGMYVNDYSLDLGEKGKKALEILFECGWEKNLLPRRVEMNDVFATL